MKPKPVPPKDLWSQLQDDRYHLLPPQRPKGAFTIAEYSAKFNLSKDRAVYELKKLVDEGKLELIKGRGTKYSPNYYVRCSQK